MKKKVFKIIQAVYDILSLAFIVFVIVAMAVTPKSGGHHDNNVNEVVEYKTRKNTGYNDQNGFQYYYNTNDLATYYSVNKIIDYLVNKSEAFSGFSLVSTDTPSTHWAYAVNNADSIGCELAYFSSDTYQARQVVKWISFDKEYAIPFETLGGTEVVECRYALSFYNSSSLVDSNRLLRIEYTIQTPTRTLNDSEMNGGLLYGWYMSSNVHTNYVSSGVYIENTLDGICLFHDVIKLDSQIDYINQYNAGYNAGRKAGYDEGYVKGSSGVETNAFTSISQAFEAVSNIFSIQVLPNLPLWVLVFTPLIVAVVIVVVKLIKG